MTVMDITSMKWLFRYDQDYGLYVMNLSGRSLSITKGIYL
jgi:hypothetical protein